MKITFILAGIAAAFALPAAAQTAHNTAQAESQAAFSAADAAQAGQKVEPVRTPVNPANDVQGMGSAAGAQMQARNQTENAPGVSGVVAGKSVQDTAGNAVGIIESLEGDLAVLATDSAKVRIPTGSFADRNGVLVIAMTKDEVNKAATRAPGTAPTSN